MYKRITHNIVEEHFAHPIANQIKAGLHSMTYDSTNPDAMYCYDPSAPAEMRPMAISITAQSRLRSESRKLWSNFLWRTRATMISSMESLPDAAALSVQLYSDTTRIADAVKAYFGEAAANELCSHLKDITTIIVDIGKGIKVGKDIAALKNSLSMHISAMADQLSRLVPESWPASAVIDIWTKLTDSWIQQAKARTIKDWPGDIAAMDIAHDLMLAPYDGPINMPAGFSDIFANGIIKHFPEKF